MLKCAWNFVVSIASKKRTSKARFTLNRAPDEAAPVELCQMIGGCEKERTKRWKDWKGQEVERKNEVKKISQNEKVENR